MTEPTTSDTALSVGDVVTITGRTLYRVTRLLGNGLVRLQSETSRRSRSERVSSLWWPGEGPGGLGPPVVADPFGTEDRDGLQFSPCGAVLLDGMAIRASDRSIAETVEWEGPALHWVDQNSPSAVGVLRCLDSEGWPWVKLEVFTDSGEAFLTKGSALKLADDLAQLAAGLGRFRRAPHEPS